MNLPILCADSLTSVDCLRSDSYVGKKNTIALMTFETQIKAHLVLRPKKTHHVKHEMSGEETNRHLQRVFR